MGLFDKFKGDSSGDNGFSIKKHDIDERFSDWPAYYFEKMISALFFKKGYTIKTNGNDAFDITAQISGRDVFVCLRRFFDRKIEASTITGIIDMCGANDSNAKIIYITTSDFTDEAREAAKNSGMEMELWNWEKLRYEIETHV